MTQKGTVADLSRRSFLTRGIVVVAGLFGLGIGVPLAGFSLSPAIRRADEGVWVPIGSLGQLKEGEPAKLTYQYTRKDGWMVAEARKTVFALRQAGEVSVLSNRCTHLGCAVDYSSSSGQFTCPCHGGIFDAQGNVLDGPPPRPLDRLASRVEDGVIYVLEV